MVALGYGDLCNYRDKDHHRQGRTGLLDRQQQTSPSLPWWPLAMKICVTTVTRATIAKEGL